MARKRKSLVVRLILFLAGLLVVLFLTVFVAGLVWLGPLVERVVERHGPEALKAGVSVDEVDAGLLRGVVKARGLVIGNPQGYREPSAIDAKEVVIRLRMRSLFSDTVVIEDILLEAPVITYEKQRGVTNLTRLQDNALAWAQLLSDKEADEPSRKVIIQRFRIRNGTLRVKLPHLPAVPVKLADIERRNIGGDSGEGQNFGHAARDVLTSLQVNASGVVEGAGAAIEKAATDALAAGKEVGRDALKAGDETLEGAGNAVKGLFGK